MVKVLFISYGGIQKCATTQRALFLGSFLVNDGYDVSLIVSNNLDDRASYGNSYNGIRIVYFEDSLVGMFDRIKYIVKAKPDIIHCFSSRKKSLLPSLLANVIVKAKFIMDFDEWDSEYDKYYSRLKYTWSRLMEAVATRYAHLIVVASNYLYDTVLKQSKTETVYIPNAVNLEWFNGSNRPTGSLDSIRKEHKVLMYIGNFLMHYNADRVLNVIEPTLNIRDDVYFVFIGDGPQKAKMEQCVARSPRMATHVLFLGEIPHKEIPPYLRSADVLLFPFEDNEINKARCPCKCFEYLASGKPIVTNNVGEVGKALDGYAYFFDYNSTGSFAEAIINALNRGQDDPSQHRKLLNEHSWDKRYEKYSNAIRRLLTSDQSDAITF